MSCLSHIHQAAEIKVECRFPDDYSSSHLTMLHDKSREFVLLPDPSAECRISLPSDTGGAQNV